MCEIVRGFFFGFFFCCRSCATAINPIYQLQERSILPCWGLNHLISAGEDPTCLGDILNDSKCFSPHDDSSPTTLEERDTLDPLTSCDSSPPSLGCCAESHYGLAVMLAHAIHEGPLLCLSQSSFISLLWCFASLFLPQEIMGSTVQQCLQTHHPSWRRAALYCLHLPSTWCVSVIMAHANTDNLPSLPLQCLPTNTTCKKNVFCS